MNVIGGPELLILATILITGVLPAWLGAGVATKPGFLEGGHCSSFSRRYIPSCSGILAFAPWPALKSTKNNGMGDA